MHVLAESVPIDLPDHYDESSPPRQALPDRVLAAMRQGHAVERLELRGSSSRRGQLFALAAQRLYPGVPGALPGRGPDDPDPRQPPRSRP